MMAAASQSPLHFAIHHRVIAKSNTFFSCRSDP